MSDNPRVLWQLASTADFSLTPRGDLAILYTLRLSGVDLPDAQAGVVIPAAELGKLKLLLEATETIRDMLAAKPPEQGAH